MNNKTSKKLFSQILKGLVCCLILTVAPFIKLIAQPLPVGSAREQQYRILQLLSDSTIKASFSNRPLWFQSYEKVFNESNIDTDTWWGKPMQQAEKSFSIHDYDLTLGGYDPVITNTFNSDLPYGENNGAAWYGRGWNNELQGGFYLTSDYFTITLRPHLIYTQNRDFKAPRFIPRYQNGDIRYVNQGQLPEYALGDRIDRPFRFGPDPYWTLDWGQSSARVHYDKIEAGISNEPLWWGPANRYALMLSNNAPGVPHIFLGTREPVHLPANIGNLEFQWIMGWPQTSRYFDLNLYASPNYINRMERLKYVQSTRFMNGINVVYTPSFLPNLSIGISRLIQQYVPKDGLAIGGDILSVFKAFPDPDEGVYDDYRDDSHFERKDPMSSVYFRWVLPESNAEFYGELYKGDHNINLRDFLMEPQHGRAYTLGFQKILEFDGPINFVKVNAEINSLEEGPIDELRPQTYIYTHSTIKQGHTNRGQLLGAAIGPGSSSQYIGMDGYFKKGKLGIFVQREVLNNHFFYERMDRYFPLQGFKDEIHHRINLNIGLNGAFKTGRVLLKGKVTWNRNFNYGRFEPATGIFYTTPVPIIDNFQYQLSIQYLL